MDTKYVIQQHVQSVKKGWREEIFSTPCERTARFSYISMCEEHSNEYFELVKVEHSETLLEYTNNGD